MNILKDKLKELKEFAGKLRKAAAGAKVPVKPKPDPANPVPVPKPVEPIHSDK